MKVPPVQYASLTENQVELRDVASRALADQPVDPRAGQDLGLFGIGIPEDIGGAGGTLSDLAVVVEAVGANVAGTHAGWQAGAVTPLFAGAADLDTQLVESLARGQALVALPIGSPWDIAGRVTPAATDDVSGSWLALAPQGSTYVLVPTSRAGNPAFVLCPVDHPAVVVTSLPAIDGTRGLSRVTLDSFSPADATTVLSSVELFDRWLERINLIAALDAIGAARAALERTLEYSQLRHQFGRPIGSFQAYKHRCATMFIALKEAQSVAFRAAREFEGRDGALLALAAGLLAPANATFIAGDAVQLHGGIGFTWEAGIHAYLKRARADEILAAGGGAAAQHLILRFRAGDSAEATAT